MARVLGEPTWPLVTCHPSPLPPGMLPNHVEVVQGAHPALHGNQCPVALRGADAALRAARRSVGYGELLPGSGITIRRFDTKRSNPWHHAPRRAALFTLSGGVNIEVGDGSVRRLGLGDVRIAEDLIGQGHVTREVGPEPRLSLFVPLGWAIPRRGGLFDWVPIRTRPD